MNTKKIIHGVAFTAALALAAPAAAQQGTVVTDGGERITGHIRDMDRSGFTVQVGGDERRIMINQIAMVEFAGGRDLTADERNRLSQGRQMVLLKDGTMLVGNIAEYERTMGGALKDLPMDHAFRVRFNNEGGGERTFLSSDIARLYFKATPTTTATVGTATTASQPTATSGNRIVVTGNRAWTPTGITVRRGEIVRFESTGRVQLSGDTNDIAEPAGSLTGRRASNAPFPSALAGALIGRIGNSQPIAIGNQTEVRMPAAGQLFLGVNDDGFDDNVGEFIVTVIPAGGGVRR